jgi:hypothetical protein
MEDTMDMVYLAKKGGQVVFHIDLQSLRDLYGVSSADMTIPLQEFEAAEGLARVIDGKIFLGKTDAEKRAEKEEEVRAKRDRILLGTVDRVNGIRWETMPEGEKARWREYRQALLDIPEQPGYPDAVTWPEIPE